MFDDTNGSLLGNIENSNATAFTPAASALDAQAVNDGNGLPDLETHTHRLLTLLAELKSITDRACIAALREAESADRLEESLQSAILTLQKQLEERDEDLQAKDEALKRNDKFWRAKVEQLETGLRDKDAQLAVRESEMHLAVSAAEQMRGRFQHAELALHESESQRKQFAERFEGEIAALKLQLLSREACLEEKDLLLEKAEGELKARVEAHQTRLQEAEAKLAAVEQELTEKKKWIEAAARRESEIGKLISRLSSECEKLTVELHDKSALIARLEEKNHNFATGGKVWKKVIGLVQDQPL